MVMQILVTSQVKVHMCLLFTDLPLWTEEEKNKGWKLHNKAIVVHEEQQWQLNL